MKSSARTSRKGRLTYKVKNTYQSALKQFIQFLNMKKGLYKNESTIQITPDDILIEQYEDKS
jgi:hypothetical protein